MQKCKCENQHVRMQSLTHIIGNSDPFVVKVLDPFAFSFSFQCTCTKVNGLRTIKNMNKCKNKSYFTFS